MDCLSRDGESFERCCLPLRPKVWAYARSLCKDADEAEDLTQQVMVRAWKGWPRWFTRAADPVDRVRAWLFVITKNQFLSSLRSDTRTQRRLTERAHDVIARVHNLTMPSGAAVLYSPTELAQQLGVQVETSDQVLQAFSTIREPWREFMRRRYFEGQSHEQIARETGYGISTISSGISRGLARMRPLVQSYARANYGLGRTRVDPPLEPTQVVESES